MWIERVTKNMRSRYIVWSSITAACLSSGWVLLLIALVIRCKLSGQPFPVLAKFSPFPIHMVITDRMLSLGPGLTVLAVALVGAAWYRERSFSTVRNALGVVGSSVLVSVLTIAINPGNYLSWFLS